MTSTETVLISRDDVPTRKRHPHLTNVIVAIDMRDCIRLTTRENINSHNHVYFKCDLKDREFWYPILQNYYKTKKRIKLRMVDRATAYARHNLHLIPKDAWITW